MDVAATSVIVYQLDDLQYQLHEGPCIDALNGRSATTSELAADHRWPRYAPAAARLGINSRLGMQLTGENRTIAGLNLYSIVSDAFSPDVVRVAGSFAMHAAHALGRALKKQQLTEALGTRKTIGQALGILMERHQVDEGRAFTMRVRASQTSNTKLRQVAAQIVDSHDSETSATTSGSDPRRP